MQKLVDGQLVDLTQAEIDARNAESVAAERARIDAHLSVYRRKKVNGGLTVNGVTVQTDTESRANLLGAKELGTSIKWKTSNGFVDLTAAQIAAIATAVGQHVQKCFDAEAAIDSTAYNSISALEQAFDAAYNGD